MRIKNMILSGLIVFNLCVTSGCDSKEAKIEYSGPIIASSDYCKIQLIDIGDKKDSVYLNFFIENISDYCISDDSCRIVLNGYGFEHLSFNLDKRDNVIETVTISKNLFEVANIKQIESIELCNDIKVYVNSTSQSATLEKFEFVLEEPYPINLQP